MPIASAIRSLIAELKRNHVRDMLLLPVTMPFAIRRFVQDRPSPAQARTQLQQALATRNQRFLELARSRVFAEPESPYKKLLDHAGCKFGDLEASLQRLGLEATLKSLAAEGVYLMPAEYKGRKTVTRGSLSFRVRPRDLMGRQNRGSSAGIVRSSGSTGRPSSSVASFDWWREVTPALAPFLETHGLTNSKMAAYEPVVGSLGAIAIVMMAMRLGVPADRFFIRPTTMNSRLESLFFGLTFHEMAFVARCFGLGSARPETAPADQLDRIVDWVEQNRRRNQTTCIRTVASNAARIARVADSMGASLEGCTFIASGEPMTPAKRHAVEKVGGAVAVTWGYFPINTIALGCGRPVHDDDMHVIRQCMAVIEHPEPITLTNGDTVRPLLFTTLYPSAAQLEINVSNGDQGVLSENDCGCPMHAAGLTLRVHNVGSFEKLTSEGLAFSIDELYALLESTLPERFGGGAGDYQLLEEEDEGGQSRLTLLVDPSVGALDDATVLDFLTTVLAEGSRQNGFMTNVWRDAGTLRVHRQAPQTSARGKILPLRLSGKASAARNTAGTM